MLFGCRLVKNMFRNYVKHFFVPKYVCWLLIVTKTVSWNAFQELCFNKRPLLDYMFDQKLFFRNAFLKLLFWPKSCLLVAFWSKTVFVKERVPNKKVLTQKLFFVFAFWSKTVFRNGLLRLLFGPSDILSEHVSKTALRTIFVLGGSSSHLLLVDLLL